MSFPKLRFKAVQQVRGNSQDSHDRKQVTRDGAVRVNRHSNNGSYFMGLLPGNAAQTGTPFFPIFSIATMLRHANINKSSD